MKRFDLFEVLTSDGYKETQDQATGWIYFTKSYQTLCGRTIQVEVETNKAHEYCRACFYERGRAFKAKTYRSTGRRTYNAIYETLEWQGIERMA